MVVVSKPLPIYSKRVAGAATSVRPFNLIKGAFSSRGVARNFPIVSGLHKTVDGALIGVLTAVVLLSALTLHWQHLWTVAFRRLETTRDLAHRLTESTALLERHLLEETRLPQTMVPTKVSNLIYLEKYNISNHPIDNNHQILTSLRDLIAKPSIHAY